MSAKSPKGSGRTLAADLSLLLTALVWGTGFVASQYAIDAGMGTSLILLLRFSLAAVVLALFGIRKMIPQNREEWRHGIIAGILLFAAFYSQTAGLRYTTPSNNAFITATNVIMVPFITWGLLRKAPRSRSFVLAVTTFVGVGILTYSPADGMVFTIGDSYTLLCALFFAGHIAYLDLAAKKMNTLRLTFMQLATAAFLSMAMFVFPDGASSKGADFVRGWLPVVYLGLFSTLLCFFIQTTAQKKTNSTKAAIFLSTEALFGAVFSVLLALEPFSWNLVAGGGIILGSIAASELTPLRNNFHSAVDLRRLGEPKAAANSANRHQAEGNYSEATGRSPESE